MAALQRQELEHEENVFSSHSKADALIVKSAEEPQQTGSLQPASHFRTKECSIAFATAMLKHHPGN